MTAITVRAPDSHKAMEELRRRLGPDALILSTRHSGGMVEVTALPPDADPRAAAAPAAAPQDPFDDGIDAEPDPEPEDPHASMASFAEALRAEAARAAARRAAASARPPRMLDPVEDLSRRLFLPEGLAEEWPTRILIAGPPGAGKSMLAARLAARLMLAESGIRPQIIAPVPASLLVEDRLRGWCRLMGLMPDRPTLAAAMHLPEPRPDAPQIVDLSDIPDAAPDLAARLIETDGAELILCLPAGLHPARIARLCHDWQAFSPTVTLTGLDQWWPEQAELTAIAQAGLRLTRIAVGTGLINSLFRPGAEDLRNWANGWSPAYREAAE
ncbi:MAG: hypothetical protein R3D90_02785 [Paracoccaceae bacterium]